MKKCDLLLAPIIIIPFLTSCVTNGFNQPVEGQWHKFTFVGTNCTINGKTDYTHDIYEKDKNVKFTIVPINNEYMLPDSVDGDVSYDNQTGVITISEMKSDIVVTATSEQAGIIHTVYLDAGGGKLTGKDILIVSEGKPITQTPIVTREGYDASKVQWYTEPDGKGTEFIFGAEGTGTPVNDDLFLHAKWGDLLSLDVSYYEDDTANPIIKQVKYGDYAAYYEPPKKAGYKFLGWRDENDQEFDFKTPIKAPTSIYAKWEAVSDLIYHVSFAITDCNMFYDGEKISADGIDIAVPKDVNPYYVKFSVKANDDIYTKPSKLTIKRGSLRPYEDYYFNKDNGDLFINLQTNISISGSCDMYKSLEDCSWNLIDKASEDRIAGEMFHVGETKSIKLLKADGTEQSFSHQVRLVAINHSISSNAVSTPLTFEFANVISDDNRDAILLHWHDDMVNYDYANSTVQIFISKEESTARSVYNMLPSDLRQVLRLSQVSYAKSEDEGQTFGIKNFFSKVFLPAVNEITVPDDETLIGEGKRYEYYKTHHDNKYLIKKDLNNHPQYYWLRSPSTSSGAQAHHITNQGELSSSPVGKVDVGIAPCFYI